MALNAGIERVPAWDRADRMRKALRVAGIDVQDMADYLGVSRNTVGRWINGRGTPSRQTMIAWSLRTGVDLGWLETGAASGGPAGYTSRDLNPEPAD